MKTIVLTKEQSNKLVETLSEAIRLQNKAKKLQGLKDEQKAIAEQMEKAYEIEQKAHAITFDFAIKYRKLERLICDEMETK